MKRVVAFLLAFAGGAAVLLILIGLGEAPSWLQAAGLPVQCAVVGGLGGAAYCLRAVYIHRCLENDWSDQWLPWYFIRPVVSLIFGAASYIFLEAGLLILDASQGPEGNNFGYLAVAFIAGLNVDGVMQRLEDIAKSAWGIEPSRMSRGEYKSGKE